MTGWKSGNVGGVSGSVESGVTHSGRSGFCSCARHVDVGGCSACESIQKEFSATNQLWLLLIYYKMDASKVNIPETVRRMYPSVLQFGHVLMARPLAVRCRGRVRRGVLGRGCGS